MVRGALGSSITLINVSRSFRKCQSNVRIFPLCTEDHIPAVATTEKALQYLHPSCNQVNHRIYDDPKVWADFVVVWRQVLTGVPGKALMPRQAELASQMLSSPWSTQTNHGIMLKVPNQHSTPPFHRLCTPPFLYTLQCCRKY